MFWRRTGWDASYHFKHFRDFLQLPHVLNGLGDAIVVILLSYLWLREPKRDRPQLKIIFYGILVFVFAVGFDQWYHEKFGIDLTTWSPSHFMMYAGTMIALLGSFLYVFRDYRHGRISLKTKRVFGLVFSYLALDGFWFPMLQHEKGVVMDYSLKHGIRLADPDLLDLFFRTQHSIYSNLPGWLYGAWAVLCAVLVFQFVKRMQLHRFGATIVAGLYLAERVVMNAIFTLTNYPLSALPYYLILVAFVFDVAHDSLKERPVARDFLTSIVPIAGIVALGFVNPEIPSHPPIPVLQTFLYSLPAAALGYAGSILVYRFLFYPQTLSARPIGGLSGRRRKAYSFS